MKIPAKNYKGIVYVQLNELPIAQQESLLKTLNSELFIKILMNQKIIGSCLQYTDYERWYHNIFKVETTRSVETESATPKRILVRK